MSDSDTLILWQPHAFILSYIGADFLSHTVTVSAESGDDSTPGARVTGSTTAPPAGV